MVIEFNNAVTVDGRLTGTIREHWVVIASAMNADAAAQTNVGRFVPRFAGTLISVKASCRVAPTGQSAVLDLHKNGTTVLTNKCKIEVSETDTDDATTQPSIATATFLAGDVFTVDIDQVGSTVAGQGYEMEIEIERTS